MLLLFAKINIAEYFKDCVEERSIELESRNIELGYFNYLDDDVIVIADAEQLRRVVNNIIGNSTKYMDKKKGIINIRLKDVGDFVQVEIEDNGKGIGQKEKCVHSEIILQMEYITLYYTAFTAKYQWTICKFAKNH